MSQFAKEGAAYQPVDHQGKACEGAALAPGAPAFREPARLRRAA